MRYLNCLILVVLCLCTRLSFAADKVVTVATLGDYAPFCIAENGVKSHQIIHVGSDAIGFTGYSWDILRESFHAMGYTIHLSITPWARAINSVKSRRVDLLFPTGVNLERNKIFNYSSLPINKASFVIYTAIDNPLTMTGLTSLEGLIIGTKRDFNYGDKWKLAIDIIKYDVKSIEQGFKMLKAGRIDGFLGYEYNWDYYIKQHKLQGQYKKFPAFDSSPEHLATMKSNQEGNQALADFDLGKAIITKSGKLEQITEKWFNH